MHYFFDTEFFDRGPEYPIQLISIGMVSEEGREFYAENSDVQLDSLNPWLKANVVPYLDRYKLNALDNARPSFGESKAFIGPHSSIGQQILKFIGMDTKPKFWAHFADHDWVLFCQLFGGMMKLPPTFPNICRDLMQEKMRLKIGHPAIYGCGPQHNALADARWNKAFFEYMKERGLEPF